MLHANFRIFFNEHHVKKCNMDSSFAYMSLCKRLWVNSFVHLTPVLFLVLPLCFFMMIAFLSFRGSKLAGER